MHRFTTLDPYAGNASDPLSFNKYGFVHSNPVMGVDPSGEFLVSMFVGSFLQSSLQNTDTKVSGGILAWATKFGLKASTYLAFALESAIYIGIGVSFGNTLWEEHTRSKVTGTGGANVKSSLLDATSRVVRHLKNVSDDESDELTSLTWDGFMNNTSIYSGDGWDVSPLQYPIELQKNAFARNISNWAPRSVTVDKKVYYAHEVNYFLWGVANAIAARRGTDHSRTLTKQQMIFWVHKYRIAADLRFIATEYDGSKNGRAAWAAAGWDYIEKGVFRAPEEFSLPNAIANTEDEYPVNGLKVTLGKWKKI